MDLVVRRRFGRALLAPLVALVLLVGYVVYLQVGSGTPWRPVGAPAVEQPARKLTLADMMLAASTAKGIHLEFDAVTAPPGAVHTNHMTLSSFQWGVGVPPPGPTGTGAGKPSLSDITVTKTFDKYSVPLLTKALKSSTTPGAIVYFTDVNTSGVAFDYLEIDLRNVVVTSDSLSSGGEVPSESISLYYDIITFKTHIPGAVAQTLTYNAKTNTTS